MNSKPQWLEALVNHLGEIEDAYSVANEGLRAYAVLHEYDPNDERPLDVVLRGLYVENAALRAENNQQYTNADSVIEELRGDVQKLQGEYAALRRDSWVEARANAKTATDFMMKNEALRADNAKAQKRIAELEAKNESSEACIREWQRGYNEKRDELRAAQQINRDLIKPGGQIAKVNTVLRDELVKAQERILEYQCQLDELQVAAETYRRKYERQFEVNHSYYARLSGLRHQLRRIAQSDTAMAQALRLVAQETLNADDRTMGAYTDRAEAEG
jgi:hypothetical protein